MQSYQALDEHLATLALWYVVNTSSSAFYKLTKQFGDSRTALLQSVQQWQALSIHKAHIERWQEVDNTLAWIEKIYDDWQKDNYGILFLTDEAYPAQLKHIYDPPPVLFYRGNVARLNDEQIAIVGSRHPSAHAQKITFDIAQYLAYAGLTVTSGLAQGVDKLAHLGALAGSANAGKTVGVMGVGIDLCYPRNHHALYAQIVREGGCLITELLPNTPANKHTFPKRNRLVAGLALATVITEAAMQSGSLITARLSAEQGKQVFAIPSLIDNINAEGCHYLIREGATLIYHPSQILEDLGGLTKKVLQSPPSSPATKQRTDQVINAKLPDPTIDERLLPVFAALNEAQDLDALVAITNLPTGELLAQLMELELLGVVRMEGAMYTQVIKG